MSAETSGADPYLVDLVDYVNRSGAAVAVRVSVRGQVLVGHLMAVSHWMAAQGADAVRAEGAEWLGVRLTEMSRELADVESELLDGVGQPRYLHLAEVSHGTGRAPSATGATWRLRLDAVDAWSLGLS